MRRILILVLAAQISLAAAAVSQNVCTDVQLTQKPGWTLSGSWTPDGTQLLIVDPLAETIWRYAAPGTSPGPAGKSLRSLGAITEPLRSYVKDLSPVTGKPRGDDLILEVSSDGFLVLNKGLRPMETRSVLAKSSARGALSIGGGLYQWTPVGNNDIFAFLDVYKTQPDGSRPLDLSQWSSAFVRFPLKNATNFKVLQTIPLEDEQRNLLRTGYSYVTAIGSTAYVLSMDVERMKLLKNEAGSDELTPLRAFPPESTKAPTLHRFKTRDDFVQMMEEIEEKSMPVGLFSQNGSLYILWRKPYPQGTKWVLSSIDPVKDAYTGSVELPIRANHVTVVPGPRHWAFIEKGPVRGYGVQDVSRVLLIPANRLQAPLRGGKVCGKN